MKVATKMANRTSSCPARLNVRCMAFSFRSEPETIQVTLPDTRRLSMVMMPTRTPKLFRESGGFMSGLALDFFFGSSS